MKYLCAYSLALFALACPAVADVPTAARTLKAFQVISFDDIQGNESDFSAILGQETRSIIYQGQPLLPKLIGPPTLVQRNQIVPILYKHGPLTLQTEGRALNRGSEGDLIRLINLSSKTSISGRIQKNGTVLVSQ
ncbi:MAG: flagellar basal body P-ring formation chaperone FlgA [Halocynthiibacter sp.]